MKINRILLAAVACAAMLTAGCNRQPADTNSTAGTNAVSAPASASNAWQNVKEGSSNAWEATKNTTTNAWDSTKQAGSNLWEKNK